MTHQQANQRLFALIDYLRTTIESAEQLSAIGDATRALDDARSQLVARSLRHEDDRLRFLAELSYGSLLREPVRIIKGKLFLDPEAQLVHGEFIGLARTSGSAPLRIEVHFFPGLNRGVFQFHFEGSTIARFSVPAILDRICDPAVSKGVVHAFLIPHAPQGELN